MGARVPISTCFLLSESVFVGEGERVLLHLHVLVGVDQIPVDVLDLVDGGDDLETKGDVGQFAVIFRDDDETLVGQEAETLQQVLSDLGAEIRV